MKNFAHGNELNTFFVDVLLVDFVCHYQNAVTVTDFDDFYEVFTFHNLASWVAWIDNDDTSRTEATFLGL